MRLSLQLLGAGTSPREGSLDLEIRPGPLEDSDLFAKPLMRIRLGAYASPHYVERCGIPDSPADLRQQSCITTSCGTLGQPGDSATWRLHRGAEVKEVRVDSRVAAPDPTINHQLAVAGVGIALLPLAVARADVEQDRLMRLLPDWEPDPVELFALYSSRLSTSPKVRVFLEFLRESFGAEPALFRANQGQS